MQAKNPKIHVERSFYRSLLALTLPVALQNVISYSVNLMDTLMLGGLGEVALSATSLANQVFFIYTVAIFGVAGGAIVLCSQYWGKKDVDSICRVASLALRISAAAGLLFTLVLFLFPRPVMQIFTAEPAVIEAGASYLRIVSLSYFFYGVTSTFLVVLRSVETVNVSVAIYGVSFAVNVFFNYVFIFGKFGAPRMGVAGAAWATILSQGVSALLCLVYMLKKFPILRTGRADWAWHGPMVRRLARMGIPTALSNSVTAIGCMILQVTINGFGSTVVAAYTAASKVEQLTTQPTFTFGLAAATFTAQNAGAGKLDRVKDGVRKATVLNLIAGLAAAVVVWLFAAPITTWFVDPGETAVIAASVQFLNIEAVFILALGVLFVYRNALQGLGNAVMPLISGGVELAMRLAAAILLSRFLGYVGVCLANPVAWTGAAVMLVPAYLAELRRQQNNALARAR